MTQDDSDLLVILAVVAHMVGINAVEPDETTLQKLEQFAREHGHPLTRVEVLRSLRMAQRELLRRQLVNE